MPDTVAFPRRNRIDLFTPAERAIYDAVQVVEAAGAHPLLTDAVILLAQARDKVADFVDDARAREIYDEMRADDPVGRNRPWIEGGNSQMQDEARRLARRAPTTETPGNG